MLAVAVVEPRRVITYSKEVGTDSSGGAWVEEDEEEGEGDDEAGVGSGTASRSAADEVAGAVEDDAGAAGSLDADRFWSEESRSWVGPVPEGPLLRVAAAVSGLLARGSADWDLLAGLAAAKEPSSDERAVLARRGRLGVAATSDADDSTGRAAGAVDHGLLHGLGRLAVADMDWPGRDGSLVAVAYSVGDGSAGDAAAGGAGGSTDAIVRHALEAGGGVAAAWDVRSSAAPVVLFSADAGVTSLCWHPFSEDVLLGALETGRVVAWDKRAGHHPVAASPLARDGHSHPVFALGVSGSANAHSVLSLSADGRLCTWPESARLSKAAVSADVRWGDVGGASHMPFEEAGEAVDVTCAAVPRGDSASLTLGGADGHLYVASLTGGGVEASQRLEGHAGPVTSVHSHPAGSTDEAFRDVLVSSSMDWTVRVWSRAAPAPEVARLDGFGDYVVDARWSPAAASVLAVGDNEGYVTLWSVGQEEAGPLGRVAQLPGGAVTRVRWSADGRVLLAGDSNGAVCVYSVSSSALAVRGVSAEPLSALLSGAAFRTDDAPDVAKAADADADAAEAAAGAASQR